MLHMQAQAWALNVFASLLRDSDTVKLLLHHLRELSLTRIFRLTDSECPNDTNNCFSEEAS